MVARTISWNSTPLLMREFGNFYAFFFFFRLIFFGIINKEKCKNERNFMYMHLHLLQWSICLTKH